MNRESPTAESKPEPTRALRDRVVIGFNPGSGSGDRSRLIGELAEQIRQSGWEVDVHSVIDEAVGAAEAAAAAGNLRAFVVGGGDGTIRVMVERLNPAIPIVILPMGTENLLARYLGIDRKVETVIRTLHSGTERWMDAGLANGRLFLVLASCGFDAEVVQRVHDRRKGHITRFTWLWPAFQTIGAYRFPPLLVSAEDGREWRGNRWAFVYNAPRYAMGLRMVPDADPGDGWLDLCTFRRGGLFRGLAYIATIFLGKHRQWTGSQHHRVQALTIRAESEQPVFFQLDGDPGGTLPVEIRVLPRRVRLLVPGS